MATTKITNASDSAAAAGKFSQLDLVSREQEQHAESELAKYFKAFVDSRQTKYARTDHHTESEEQNYLRNQSSKV